MEVVGSADDPVLAGDESTGADGDIGQLKGLDNLLRLVGPDVDVACRGQLRRSLAVPWRQRGRTAVEGGEDPWFLGMEVNALDSLAASVELALLSQEVSASQRVEARC